MSKNLRIMRFFSEKIGKIGTFQINRMMETLQLPFKVNKYGYIMKQECIPVGCVPSAAVAVYWGGGVFPGGGVCQGGSVWGVCMSAQRGVCLGCVCVPGGGVSAPVNGMTDR